MTCAYKSRNKRAVRAIPFTYFNLEEGSTRTSCIVGTGTYYISGLTRFFTKGVFDTYAIY